MAEVIFNYEGINTIIQCDENEKIEEIIKKILIKINNSQNNNLVYLYNGQKINNELTFKEQANELDKNRKKMYILAIIFEEEENNIKEVISKDIICPTCKENSLIDIKDYKININGCKNNHQNENILLNLFEETQKIRLNDIKCNICEVNNKSNTYKNEFYICITCNKNMCTLCKSKHDNNHRIINYDDKNNICKKHNKSYLKYCKTCKEDICIICEKEHDNHDIFELSNILINKDDLILMMKDLKDIINKFKYEINIIKEVLDKMSNILDIYYKINNDIINNYNIDKKNYHLLLNINNIKNSNDKFIKELNDIINNNKIYEYSFNYFYINNNGERYIGQLINDKKEGKGIIYYNNGNKYEGDFKNDKFEGKGIYYYNNEPWKEYEGEWKNDQREGKGVYYYNNGDKYDGDWKNNLKDGKGKFYYNNEPWKDDKYEGEWKKVK